MKPKSVYFKLAESLEGHIITKICETLHMRPSEVLREKYNPDIRFLWRKYYMDILREHEEYEKMKKEVGD